MNQETLSFRPVSLLDLLTPEQHQAILFGPYFNGLDMPLKSVEQVKAEK
jgi:hypothetical protein